jgi:hypothetical protein
MPANIKSQVFFMNRLNSKMNESFYTMIANFLVSMHLLFNMEIKLFL